MLAKFTFISGRRFGQCTSAPRVDGSTEHGSCLVGASGALPKGVVWGGALKCDFDAGVEKTVKDKRATPPASANINTENPARTIVAPRLSLLSTRFRVIKVSERQKTVGCLGRPVAATSNE